MMMRRADVDLGRCVRALCWGC